MAGTALMKRIWMALSAKDVLAWRNNVGQGWAGKFVSRDERTGLTVLANARPIKFGLCVGSGDIIGGVPTVITPDMVGKTVLVFASWEVKEGTGRSSKDQKNFAEVVTAAGGIGVVVRSEAEALESIGVAK